MELARQYRPLAVELLRETIRIPADHVDRPSELGGDPACGLSNHEGPRLQYLRRRILEVGAVDRPEDVGFDAFGNLVWSLEDPADPVAANDKTVIYFDGHTDTVASLRPRWREAIGGIDAYEGLVDPSALDRSFLRSELGHLPPDDQWEHLVWGRGSADQLGGVVAQVVASKIMNELRAEGSLAGVVVRSYATVAEEDNDGGGPMFVFGHELRDARPGRIPDAVILTEGTGDREKGAVGIYRGQRGRMQIEVELTGKSCHGSMPWEGRNPLEYGAAIIAEAAAGYERGEGFAQDDFLGPGTRTASFATLVTPSDCAVPERFSFRLDRRLTAGEEPRRALTDVEQLATVRRAREQGLSVDVRIPVYDQATWNGYTPGNPQIYPGWVTPEEHPAIQAAVRCYRRISSPLIGSDDRKGGLRREPRVDRWIFSTDGVGMVLPVDATHFELLPSKRWVRAGSFQHPPLFGIGPGIEQNTHKIGECVDAREFDPVIAFLARFPTLYRESR
jgi:putative selenium metabolism hydrolase